MKSAYIGVFKFVGTNEYNQNMFVGT
jgi:hypothetical protein